jgi:hypothetical protein
MRLKAVTACKTRGGEGCEIFTTNGNEALRETSDFSGEEYVRRMF